MPHPELIDYLNQIQNEQQQNEMETQNYHPFQSGVNMAMNAVRQSMGIPSQEDQHREAVGRGFINFGKAMGRPFRSRLEGINQALGEGMDAFLQQRALNAQMNAQSYLEAVRQQEAERKYLEDIRQSEIQNQYRQQHLASQERMHGETLAEQKRIHDLTHKRHLDSLSLDKKSLELKEKLLNPKNIEKIQSNSTELESPYGIKEVPLNKMDKKFVSKFGELSAKEISQIPINKRTIETVNQMKEIFDKHPDIGSSFINIVENDEGKSENSWWNLLTRQFVSNEKLSAIQQLKKLSNDLNLSTVMGLPGRSGTDIMKRAIRAAAPSGRLTYESFNKIASSWEKRAQENIERAKIMEDSLSRGMYPFLNEGEIGSVSPERETSIAGDLDLSNLSDEELMNLYHNE